MLKLFFEKRNIKEVLVVGGEERSMILVLGVLIFGFL